MILPLATCAILCTAASPSMDSDLTRLASTVESERLNAAISLKNRLISNEEGRKILESYFGEKSPRVEAALRATVLAQPKVLVPHLLNAICDNKLSDDSRVAALMLIGVLDESYRRAALLKMEHICLADDSIWVAAIAGSQVLMLNPSNDRIAQRVSDIATKDPSLQLPSVILALAGSKKKAIPKKYFQDQIKYCQTVDKSASKMHISSLFIESQYWLHICEGLDDNSVSEIRAAFKNLRNQMQITHECELFTLLNLCQYIPPGELGGICDLINREKETVAGIGAGPRGILVVKGLAEIEKKNACPAAGKLIQMIAESVDVAETSGVILARTLVKSGRK